MGCRAVKRLVGLRAAHQGQLAAALLWCSHLSYRHAEVIPCDSKAHLPFVLCPSACMQVPGRERVCSDVRQPVQGAPCARQQAFHEQAFRLGPSSLLHDP